MAARTRKRASAPPSRVGFTLIELLVVIAILLILAGVLLFALAGVAETAREARTRSLISKIDNVIMAQYQTYMTRRVPVDTTNMSPKEAASARLQALRELIKYELPDRYLDITANPVVVPRTALSKVYKGGLLGDRSEDYEEAECLYLIVAALSENGVMEHFSGSDIGDKDNDGMNEFIDGWGQPIKFLRWPAGFKSPLQQEITGSHKPENHDVFDTRLVEKDAYALYPLVYSAGPDKRYSLHNGYQSAISVQDGTIDPYQEVSGAPPEDDGEPTSGKTGNTNSNNDGWEDNIHSHRTETGLL